MDFSRLARDIDLGVGAYHDRPREFAEECMNWPEGKRLAPYQADILSSLQKHERVVVRAPRRAGKTATTALAVLWFALTRDAAKEDFFGIVTGPVMRQLRSYMWMQLRTTWVPRLNWQRVGREPFTANELMLEELRLRHGSIILAAATDPAKLEGAHASQVLVIFDESKAIPEGIFDSLEGSFMGAGGDTSNKAYVMVSSTPGAASGRFYDLCMGRIAGFHHRHVRQSELLKAGQVSKRRLREAKETYGEDSAWWKNHALGEFAEDTEDRLIPLEWVEEAERRWEEIFGNAKPSRTTLEVPVRDGLEQLHAIGVDLGFGGKDKSVYALRHGPVISTIIWRQQESYIRVGGEGDNALVGTLKQAADIAALARVPERFPQVTVDAGGAGEGVYSGLRAQGIPATAFVSGGGVTGRTGDGVFELANPRAALWWNLRECLDPLRGVGLALPPDELLKGDLLAPRRDYTPAGRLLIESKDSIRKRLKRSTDAGDAVALACWAFRLRSQMAAPEVILSRTGSSNRLSGRHRAGGIF